MSKIDDLKAIVNKIRYYSQQLKDATSSLKEEDKMTKYYIDNLKRLSLQSLDLSNAYETQLRFIANQKIRNTTKRR